MSVGGTESKSSVKKGSDESETISQQLVRYCLSTNQAFASFLSRTTE